MQNKKGLSLERLNALQLVNKHSGIAKAAPGDVSKQNLLGRQLRELEEYFEVSLTTKNGKVIGLNEYGKQLALITFHFQNALQDFEAETANKRKEFRIGAGGTLFSQLVSSRAALLQKYRLTLHLRDMFHEDMFNALEDGKVDGVISWAKPIHHFPIKSVRLGIFNYALYGSKKLLRQRDVDGSWKSKPFAHVKHRDMSKEVKALLMSDDIIHVSDNNPAFKLVSSGRYIAILPQLLGEQLPRGEFTKIELPLLRPYERTVYYYWNPKHIERRGFRHTMLEQIAETFRLS